MIKTERGSAVVAALITAFLLVAFTLPFLTWAGRHNKELTRQSGASQAQWYADAGIELAYKSLKSPDLEIWLPAGTEHTLPTMAMRQGTANVTLRRSADDPSLVEMEATGYYHLPGGAYRDSGNRESVRGRVRVVARVINVAEFLAAKPRGLKIDYGTNVANGKVYGEDLTFMPRGSSPFVTPTQIQEALYFQNCTGADATADVILANPPRKLTNPLDLGVADLAMRSLYFEKTQGPGSVPEQVLNVAQPFSGLRTAPSGGAPNVYFAEGDLHVGTSAEPLTAGGVYTIYATGSVYIHNSILLRDSNSWIAIVTEKDLVILDSAPPDSVPVNLELNGNYYANGNWMVRGVARPAGSVLRFNGGFVVHGRIEFSETWPTDRGCSRLYSFARSPDPSLLLPNLTTQLDYRVHRAR